MPVDFPYITTLVSAFLAFGLGLVWYHPKVLGDKWMEARGIKKEKGMKPDSPWCFVISLSLWVVASFFFTFLIGFLDITSAGGLLNFASLLWVAFAMPPVLMGSLYTGYPFQAVAIDSAYQLAGYYLLGVSHIVAGLLFA